MSIVYDVAIRTVGKGGEKYQALLNSIKNLDPQPRKIWVILPEGGNEPPEKISTENFVYAKKGMMTQRIATLDFDVADYILFCDDDIQFDSDFVKKLHRAVTELGYSFATGEVLDFLPPAKGLKKFLPIIHAAAVPTIFNKDKYVTILRSNGWSYNRFTPTENLVLPTDSAAGCMFYASKEAFKNINFEDELVWAQHGHLAPADDQIMFYKAKKLGYTPCVVTDAHYDHLSAKSATSSPEAKANKSYWAGFNRAVFWHRFIYSTEKNFFGKFLARSAFNYYFLVNSIHLTIKRILKPSEKHVTLQIKGMRDGLKYTKTEEYKNLPRITE
jgi:GT2 family glycosyltransferase